MSRIEFSEEFQAKIRDEAKDGRDFEIAQLMYEEAVRLGIVGKTHDDQVKTALFLGIMAHETLEQGVDELFEQFHDWALDLSHTTAI